MTIEVNSFKTKVHSPAINRNLGMLLEFYTNMIKSNFTVSLMWFTLTCTCMLKMLYTHSEC